LETIKDTPMGRKIAILAGDGVDAVYVPGGADSAAALTSNANAIHFVQEAFKHFKPLIRSTPVACVPAHV
jgi:putative intracellular protease/amidase